MQTYQFQPPQFSVAPASTPSGVVFETSFHRPQDWNQTNSADWYPNAFGTMPGVGRHGGWLAPGGVGDEIIDAANYPGGAGGKGFRHYRGNGQNTGGGGLGISFPAPIQKFWLRMYMRYSAGFAWTNGSPHYIKDHYYQGGFGQPIFGYYGGWGFNANGANLGGSVTWAQSQGGTLGSGLWNCYEYHLDQATGKIQFWFNNQLALDVTGANLGAPGLQYFALGENQNEGTGANPLHYTDYDDIVISTTGRVGPL